MVNLRANANSKSGYDQNGTDIMDDTPTDSCLDETENNGMTSDRGLTERQDSQEKENREMSSPRRKIAPASRNSPHTTELDHDSSYSSLNADSSEQNVSSLTRFLFYVL